MSDRIMKAADVLLMLSHQLQEENERLTALLDSKTVRRLVEVWEGTPVDFVDWIDLPEDSWTWNELWLLSEVDMVALSDRVCLPLGSTVKALRTAKTNRLILPDGKIPEDVRKHLKIVYRSALGAHIGLAIGGKKKQDSST
jgi:hypothetical protein